MSLRRQAVRFSLSLLLTLPVVSATAAEPEPWPQANGPAGNYTPLPTDVELIDGCAQAKQVWDGETRDLAYAKGSVSGYIQHLARWEGHPGSSSGPILADGKLFVTTFRPTGDAWAENLPQRQKLENSNKPLSDVERKRLRQNLRIGADDLLVAIDAKTGATLWTAVEADEGLNRYMGKRQGFCVSPAYHDGKVFSLGTTGRLFAYNAKDGTRLWQADIGQTHQDALEHRAKVLEKKTLPGGMGWDSSLVVVDGVLIVPLFDGVDLSLRGVDVKTGEKRWELPKACSRHATAAVWSHQDRQYVLSATVSGELRLIDPQDGKVLWTVSGLGPNHFSLTPLNDLVFVNAGSERLRKEGSSQRYGRLAGYRLSLSGAQRVWEHPEEPKLLFATWMDSCARRFLAVADGRVYYRAHGIEKSKGTFNVLEAATGKVLAQLEIPSPALQYYPLGDRLLTVRDASHRDTELAFLKVTDNQVQQLAEFWKPPHFNTTAYEVYLEHPVHNGLLYLRTGDGRVACYDLRKSK